MNENEPGGSSPGRWPYLMPADLYMVSLRLSLLLSVALSISPSPCGGASGVCVTLCVRECVGVCARARVCVCVCACVCVHQRACIRYALSGFVSPFGDRARASALTHTHSDAHARTPVQTYSALRRYVSLTSACSLRQGAPLHRCPPVDFNAL